MFIFSLKFNFKNNRESSEEIILNLLEDTCGKLNAASNL